MKNRRDLLYQGIEIGLERDDLIFHRKIGEEC